MKAVIAKSLLKSYTYLEYRKIVSELFADGKSTGNTQSDDLLKYSGLNETRMNRLDKTVVVPEENALVLRHLSGNYTWLVISEGWCGDAAQLLPVFYKMANESNKIDLRIVLRDSNDELMDLFLTNGSRSIPKLIILNKETLEVVANFGPRPHKAAELVREYKEIHGIFDEQIKTDLQLWYLHDKGLSTQKEIIDLMLDLER